MRFRPLRPLCVLMLILLMVTSWLPAAAADPDAGVWQVETIANADYLYSVRLAVGQDGVPVVVYYRVSPANLVVIRRQAGGWTDLQAPVSCDATRIKIANLALAVDSGQNVHLAYVCVGTVRDDVRYARYDHLKQEWTSETVDAAGVLGTIGALSLGTDVSWNPAVSYVIDGRTLRAAARAGPDDWRVSTVTSMDGVTIGNTSIRSPGVLAYDFIRDGKTQVANAYWTNAIGWQSTTVAEGYLIGKISDNSLSFRRGDELYFSHVTESKGWRTLYVTDRASNARMAEEYSTHKFPVIALNYNDGLALASLSDVSTWTAPDFTLRRVLASHQVRDFTLSFDGRGHALLTQTGDSAGDLYYASGPLPPFISTRNVSLGAKEGIIWLNNRIVPAGERTPFQDGDRVSISQTTQGAKLNAECTQGAIAILAIQARASLPPEYQKLSDTQVVFLLLLANPKLMDFLNTECGETPKAVAGRVDAAEEPHLLFEIKDGAIEVAPQAAGFTLDVRTPHLTCRAADGSQVVVAYDEKEAASLAWVIAGSATVTPADTTKPPRVLEAGRAAYVTASGIEERTVVTPCFLPVIRK